MSKYTGWIRLIVKLSWRDCFESLIRAEKGEIIHRPFGSAVHLSDWKQLQFNPVYLSNVPKTGETEIDTKTLLGPQAEKPLVLKIPVLIGAMSYGNSFDLRTELGLAKTAEQCGIAVNTGNGPYLKEVRKLVSKYTLQLPRSFWSRSEEILREVELIEIGLGHSAWASAPIRISGNKMSNQLAGRIGTIPGLDAVIHSRMPEGENHKQLGVFVSQLKKITGGIPIAFKIGATHYLEKEMECIIEAGADVIVFDGLEGGTHGSPPTLQDHVGLPTLPALCRAVKYLEINGLREKVSLVVGGGLFTPGDFLKCLALGADAVIIGTIAALTLVHTQVTQTMPFEPPTELLYFDGKKTKEFDFELGAKNLSNYLLSCIKEMKDLTRALGKRSFKEIGKADLIALDQTYAKMAGVSDITNEKGEY